MSAMLDRPPEGDHGMLRVWGQFDGGVDVDAAQHAVTADVGVR